MHFLLQSPSNLEPVCLLHQNISNIVFRDQNGAVRFLIPLQHSNPAVEGFFVFLRSFRGIVEVKIQSTIGFDRIAFIWPILSVITCHRKRIYIELIGLVVGGPGAHRLSKRIKVCLNDFSDSFAAIRNFMWFIYRSLILAELKKPRSKTTLIFS
jgi:hypothetical protein